MRERLRPGPGSRWISARRWCRGEPRVVPLEFVLALRRPSVVRLQTVVRAERSVPRIMSAPPPRDVRQERTVVRPSAEPDPRVTRVEVARHTRAERTLITRPSRYGRIEAGPSVVIVSHRDVGQPGPLPPRPTLVPMTTVALNPAAVPSRPTPSIPAAVSTRGESGPAGLPGGAGPAGPAAFAAAVPDIEAIATQVLRQIERRAIAQRERMGRF